MPALAGGVLSIGYTHVDAHEAAATWIAAIELMKEKGWTLEETADFLAMGIRNKEKDDAFVRRFGDRRVIPGWHHPQHIRDLRSPRIIELAEHLGVAGDHVKFVVALENATEKHWGRKLYMNVSGAISSTLVDMGFNPDECLAFCAIARSVSITAHCIEEKTREKGWRASSGSKITQPLDLALQKPDYYDGPPDRELPEERIIEPLTRTVPLHGSTKGQVDQGRRHSRQVPRTRNAFEIAERWLREKLGEMVLAAGRKWWQKETGWVALLKCSSSATRDGVT